MAARALVKPAARRAARTVSAALRGQSARALAALLPAALFLYCSWRAGEQVTAGLDPNFTVNAWGGPSYLGAMACHYLDCAVLIAAAAWLLGKILLPGPAWPPAGHGGAGHQLRRAAQSPAGDDARSPVPGKE